ncbi:hypothetical protein LXA43DRAFT_1089952 [Ganoderma leucocontextum]|nr:hypothetical protein LXA43DRAFT_1089952 [Ganoderma leucocontextum]
MSAIPSTDSEDITSSAFDYERRLPHPKAAGCYWCHKLGSRSQQLKRCAKCGIVLYCSKECQVASWPTHKSACLAPVESEHHGKLTKAYQKWVDVHHLSLHALSGGLIGSTGGAEFSLSNLRSLLVTLFPHIDSWDNGDPAKWFSIVDARICDKDENPYGPTEWPGQARESALGELVGADPGPDIIGVLPVTYFIVNEKTTIHDLYPIHRQDSDSETLECGDSGELGPGGEEFVAGAYDDLANLCIACINTGIVFHDPKDQRANKFLPEVGSYVRARSGGSWRWAQKAGAWEVLNQVMQMPDSGMDKAGLTAQELWWMWGLRF